MKIKQLSVVLAISVLISIVSPVSYAEADLRENVSVKSIETFEANDVITEELAARLEKLSDNDKILVTIRLKDDLDITQVDTQARERAGVTEAQLEKYEEQSQNKASPDEEKVMQEEIRAVYSKIKKERTKILSEYYQKLNAKFLADEGLDGVKCESVSRLLPWISGIELTKAQIFRLVCSGRVCYVDVYENEEIIDFASVQDTRSIIGGDVAISSGYSGNGIKVGLVERGHPILETMGTDSVNITATNSGASTDHATMTSGIIKKMAPNCSIYSGAATNLNDAVTCCATLIVDYDVSVINISAGVEGDGKYNSIARRMDELVQTYKVAIVVAAGNYYPGETDGYINQLGIAANVITVGAVTTQGTSPSASGAFTFAYYSCYKENVETINKPDICAPGRVQIYSYSEQGTSLAAPHVTGTIVQMLSANYSLQDRPESLKAALMESAFYNAGTDMTYVSGTMVSNYEGAGVINAKYCFNAARNNNFTRYGMSGPGTYPVSIYCNDASRPYRIAASWYVTSNTSTSATTRLSINIYLYKNGQLVASSTANASVSNLYPSTNYEIIELDAATIRTYGTGEYQVRISLNGSSFSGMSPNYVGVVYGSRT